MITTLIFDLDGTLTNTLDDLHESVGHALSVVGLPQNDIKDTRRFLGNGIKNLISKSVDNVMPNASEELKDRDLVKKHFLEAKIFEGKTFWEVEDKIIWYDRRRGSCS